MAIRKKKLISHPEGVVPLRHVGIKREALLLGLAKSICYRDRNI